MPSFSRRVLVRFSFLSSATINCWSSSSCSAASECCFLVALSSFLASAWAVLPASSSLLSFSSFLPASASFFSSDKLWEPSFSAVALSCLICAFRSLSTAEASLDSTASFSRRALVRFSFLASTTINCLSSSSWLAASVFSRLVPVSSFLTSVLASLAAARSSLSFSSFLLPALFSRMRHSCSALREVNFSSADLRFCVTLRVSAFNNLAVSVSCAFSS